MRLTKYPEFIEGYKNLYQNKNTEAVATANKIINEVDINGTG